jgi:hypothetical protein
MKVQSLPSRVLIATLIATVLSSCGSSGISGNPAATTQPQGNSAFDTPVDLDPSADYAAYPYSFTTYGSAPTTVTSELQTDTKLVVKINSETSGVISAPGVSSNFSAEYGCAQFQVTLQMKVNGVWQNRGSKVTSPLNVAGTAGCDGGVASQTIDFSAYMTPGHANVRIQVTSLKTDFYCILYKKCLADYMTYWSNTCYWARQPNASLYACPLKTIYSTHNVNGSLEVQINGTSFVN